MGLPGAHKPVTSVATPHGSCDRLILPPEVFIIALLHVVVLDFSDGLYTGGSPNFHFPPSYRCFPF